MSVKLFSRLLLVFTFFGVCDLIVAFIIGSPFLLVLGSINLVFAIVMFIILCGTVA